MSALSFEIIEFESFTKFLAPFFSVSFSELCELSGDLSDDATD